MSQVPELLDLPGPFVCPAAWKGPELFQRDDWLFELGQGDLDQLEAALGTSQRSTSSVEATTAADFPLPPLGGVLARVQDRLEHGSGACMVRRLPVEDYSEAQLRRLFRGIAAHLGTPVSQSASGELLFSVRDEGWKKGQPQARGPNTKRRLSFHSDRCDVIGFLCVHQAQSGGDNQLVSSVTLFNEMRRRWPESARVLMQSFWYQRHSVDTANEQPYCQQPIFSYYAGRFAANYLRVLIDRAYAAPDLPDLSDEQREALDRFEALAADPALHVTFRQQPGDLLFLNNWVTLHRREAFEDPPDSKDRRLLLRVWLSVPNSRPLDPRFAANYGSTAAGAVRGGMRPLQVAE